MISSGSTGSLAIASITHFQPRFLFSTLRPMNWISSLEKRFGSWAIPNLSLYLIGMQVLGVVLVLGNYASVNDMFLHGSSVMDRGQGWRLVTFMMMPKTFSPLFLVFAFYIFYLMGSALEHEWGVFRFNLFVWSGYLLTAAMSFINPGAVISNFYFLGCVFLAFATLFPNFELLLFFFLPVKVKWLGLLTFAYYVVILLEPSGGPAGAIAEGNKLAVAAAFANYALFFGKTALHNLTAARRRKAYQSQAAMRDGQPRHQCAECGATDKSDPSLHFRYCSTCGKCFCEHHVDGHQHQ